MTHSCCSSEVVPVLVLEQRQLDHGGIVVLYGGLWRKNFWMYYYYIYVQNSFIILETYVQVCINCCYGFEDYVLHRYILVSCVFSSLTVQLLP